MTRFIDSKYDRVPMVRISVWNQDEFLGMVDIGGIALDQPIDQKYSLKWNDKGGKHVNKNNVPSGTLSLKILCKSRVTPKEIFHYVIENGDLVDVIDRKRSIPCLGTLPHCMVDEEGILCSVMKGDTYWKGNIPSFTLGGSTMYFSISFWFKPVIELDHKDEIDLKHDSNTFDLYNMRLCEGAAFLQQTFFFDLLNTSIELGQNNRYKTHHGLEMEASYKLIRFGAWNNKTIVFSADDGLKEYINGTEVYYQNTITQFPVSSYNMNVTIGKEFRGYFSSFSAFDGVLSQATINKMIVDYRKNLKPAIVDGQ